MIRTLAQSLESRGEDCFPDDSAGKDGCETDPVDLDHFHKTVYNILCKVRSVSFPSSRFIYMLLLENTRRNRYWKISAAGAFPFVVGIGSFQCGREMKTCKKFSEDFEICLSFWLFCVIV